MKCHEWGRQTIGRQRDGFVSQDKGSKKMSGLGQSTDIAIVMILEESPPQVQDTPLREFEYVSSRMSFPP